MRAFEWVNVFTATPFGGNPLPVVLDAGGLSTSGMQSIAREFNTVETTFVLPPTDPAHTAHVRIFTPLRELPFAGHPNVGTAYVLARQGHVFGQPVPDMLLFEELAGLVPVQVLRAGGIVTGAAFRAPEAFAHRPAPPSALIASALGLDPIHLDTAAHGPVVGSVGLPFVLVALQTRDALAAIAPDVAALTRLFAAAEAMGVLAYAPAGSRDEAAGPCDWSSRMVCLQPTLIEDPATGSANAALVALRATLAGAPQSYRMAQGVELGRPSLLQAWTDADGVHVGGSCVPMMVGHLTYT